MRRLMVVSLAASLVAGGALASGLEIEVAGEANGAVVVELFDDVAPAACGADPHAGRRGCL